MLKLYILYILVITFLFIVVLLLIKALNAFITIYNNVNTYFKYNKINH